MEEYDEFYQSDFEKLGFDIIPLNLTEPGRWLTYQNYIFDYKGNIIKKYDYWIDDVTNLTSSPFDNCVAVIVNDPTLEYKDQKYALMDFDGNLLTEFFDEVGEGWVDHTYIEVRKGDKYAIVDKTGKQYTDFRFDWCTIDYEWLNISHNYSLLRVDKAGKDYTGVFAFTGKLILEPLYETIEIHSQYRWFESTDQRTSALLNDYIIATDYEGNKFRFTHHHGLEQFDENE